MPKTLIIIQARMGSSRLPNKVLINVAGKPILQHVIDRCKMSIADEVIVATSTNPENDEIEKFCSKIGVSCFRGSENDVLDRYYNAAKEYKADVVVRITGDCPLLEPKILNKVIEEFKSGDYDYISNVLERGFPRGLDTEVFSFKALERAHALAKEKPHREHVTAFIYGNPSLFKIRNIGAEGEFKRPDIRLTIDTPHDLAVLNSIFANIPNAAVAPIEKIIKYLDEHPYIRDLNQESELAQRTKNIEEGVKQKIADSSNS